MNLKIPKPNIKYGATLNIWSQNARFGIKYHLIRTTDVKITIVDVMIRNTDAKEMYFSYLVALRCIIDKVDFADPVRNNAILMI